MLDPNNRQKKKIAVYLSLILIFVPFVFIYLKYLSVEEKNEPIVKVIKEVQIKEIKSSDATIYRQDSIGGVIQIPFEVRDMKISNDKKRLFTLGHDRDGISIIDISNIEKIKLLGLFYFPEAKHYVEDIDIAESKDGQSLYVVSPNIGVLKLDIRDFKNIKVIAKFDMKGCFRIKLSNDGNLAFIKTIDGMAILDLSKGYMQKVGEFKGFRGAAPIEKGDIAIYSDKYIFMSDFEGLYMFDISDPKNIKKVASKKGTGAIISIKISEDKKRLYMNKLESLDVYDISEFGIIKPLGKYIADGRLYNFDVSKDRHKAYLAISRGGKNSINLSGVDIVNLSNELEPIRMIKRNAPEAEDVVMLLSPDEKYMIVSTEVKFEGFIGVYQR
ncbi:hypothetical protein [Campylobacter sp. RM16190]|uniref:hypothetical protein n=1 Tax=Campylobacter sp. RM16190 TaxID=1705727 RepID=UPI0014747B54|nr:hypothetical protein [Campylobacter sp. RM16190]